MAETLEEVVFKFDGGLASIGQMHLYEYSRAQYGFARILTTVEKFRRTGEVIDKVSKNQRIDLIVSVPKAGSFELDIKVAVLSAAESYFKSISFDLLFSLVLDRLIPSGEEHQDLLSSIAKIVLAAGDGGPLSDERLRIIAKGGRATAREGMLIVQWALDSRSAHLVRRGINYEQLRRAQLILESDYQRSEILARESAGLSQLDYAELDKLVAKIRPMFNDVAVPFGSSSTTLTIGNAKSDDTFYRLDKARFEFIKSRVLDETVVEILAMIKSYDRETGSGRMRSDEFKGVKSFQVDPNLREEIQPEIINAMNRRSILLQCARYTDRNGIVTSYIIRGVELS